jgi:4-nitrophenyl phosphatase
MPSRIPPSLCIVMFDLDGVIWRGSKPFPEAGPAVAWLAGQGVHCHFLTNNSTRTRADYVRLLAGAGITTGVDRIMTSAYATALYMDEQGWRGKKALVIGEGGLKEELLQVGVGVMQPPDWRGAEAVVVGLTRTFDYEALFCAQQAILSGATFIASNRDGTYPTEEGLLPGAGSIVAAVAAAGHAEPIVVGKPEPFMVNKVLAGASCLPEQAALVGDRLDTDIKLAKELGIFAILVLTGVTTMQAAQSAGESCRPDAIMPNLGELPSLLKGGRSGRD